MAKDTWRRFSDECPWSHYLLSCSDLANESEGESSVTKCEDVHGIGAGVGGGVDGEEVPSEGIHLLAVTLHCTHPATSRNHHYLTPLQITSSAPTISIHQAPKSGSICSWRWCLVWQGEPSAKPSNEGRDVLRQIKYLLDGTMTGNCLRSLPVHQFYYGLRQYHEDCDYHQI